MTVWDSYWEGSTVAEALARIEAESSSLRFRRITRALGDRLGTLAELDVVELGAGVGTTSIALARLGARITLIDESLPALAAARATLDAAGCAGEVVQADLFAPDIDRAGRYDVAMSFGVAEHFRGDMRRETLAAHLRWVRPGGVAVVAVPNRLCPSYRVWKWWLERRGRWDFGYEEPFLPSELRRLARSVRGREVEVLGSSAIGDALRFATPMIAHRLTAGRLRLPSLETPSPVDPLLSYALAVVYTAPAGYAVQQHSHTSRRCSSARTF